jgi:hypothetical protein
MLIPCSFWEDRKKELLRKKKAAFKTLQVNMLYDNDATI